MRKLAICITLVSVACLAGSAYAAHSDYGCHNCHVPHWAVDPAVEPDAYGVPLWSPLQLHDLPVYELYSSPTFDALGTDIGQPDGPSKLCLSCHDGSYAYVDDPGAIFLAADLKRSHPISCTYDTALSALADLYDPDVALSGLGGTISQDLLDGQGKMQCSSCHDVHKQGIGDYLLRYDSETALCKTCHDK
jgi:predicted CXXCH cytochrome family protein